MRPLRLELEGFTVFRQATTVDFTGADLFALAGPTGAGKTSLIDAVTFALYGAVPRLDRRAVAPVVSQNLTEARVRLDFAVGEKTYTAVRVVRATKAGGATTKEARLEQVERAEPSASDQPAAAAKVLAGNADEVTSAVTDLLGLTYEHFVTCVSLPQGQFARFLHDKPRDRQDLLVRLLGLGIYDRVAMAARQRASVARSQVDVLDGRLVQLAEATTGARDEAQARVAELAVLGEKLTAAKAALDGLADRTATARRSADEREKQVRLLDGLAAPDGISELAEAIASTATVRSRLAEAEREATEAVTAAEAGLAELPARPRLEDRRRDLARQDELTELLQKGQSAAAEAEQAARHAADGEAAAETTRQEAADALERVRIEQRAQALVPQLHVGEPCPVCKQTVHDLPEQTSPEVTNAEATLTEADRGLKAAIRHHGDARAHQARVDEKLARVERDLAEIAERLAGVEGLPDDDQQAARNGEPGPDLAEVEDLLDQVTAAEQAVERARQADRALRQERANLEAQHDRLVAQEADARRAFDAARDRLAVLQPPAFERQNLADDWAALIDWASEQRPALVDEADRQRALADDARREHARRWEELAELCRSAGVEPAPSPRDESGRLDDASTPRADGLVAADVLTEAVAVAHARAEDAVQRIEADLAEAERLRQQQQDATEHQQVAELLAEHLKANRFEKWLLDEAVLSLAAGASDILGDLSGGAYALSVDPKSGGFTVVDHANASQPRPARTLSGGETFLASLALALALADQVAELATGGTARLEALFLDEGFGTLDADALDVVATALDELGARGRMVGIVTHVRELAERLPVRFEVRKVGANAAVERVEAT